jgi:hypothetical protein
VEKSKSLITYNRFLKKSKKMISWEFWRSGIPILNAKRKSLSFNKKYKGKMILAFKI